MFSLQTPVTCNQQLRCGEKWKEWERSALAPTQTAGWPHDNWYTHQTCRCRACSGNAGLIISLLVHQSENGWINSSRKYKHVILFLASLLVFVYPLQLLEEYGTEVHMYYWSSSMFWLHTLYKKNPICNFLTFTLRVDWRCSCIKEMTMEHNPSRSGSSFCGSKSSVSKTINIDLGIILINCKLRMITHYRVNPFPLRNIFLPNVKSHKM